MLNRSCKTMIASFAGLLDTIKAGSLHSSPYSKRYLHHLLQHKYYYLAIYAHVLDHALMKSGRKINELTLLDFGAGNGLLGMFARHCGFKRVILCDISRNFVEASRMLAAELNITIDAFITGEIETVKNELTFMIPDIIAGTDVIEHIYDLDDFFAEIKTMNPGMITVLTTASNPDNYFKVKQLKKMQVKDELEGGHPSDFALAGEESHLPYLEIRKNIIRENFPGWAGMEKMVVEFAKATRGLRREDIIERVQYFIDDRAVPAVDPHDTNTCHPETGSWSERILPIKYYRSLYNRYGFELQVKSGFYNSFEPGLKSRIRLFMNLLVKIMGKKTAPFITLIGFPHK